MKIEEGSLGVFQTVQVTSLPFILFSFGFPTYYFFGCIHFGIEKSFYLYVFMGDLFSQVVYWLYPFNDGILPFCGNPLQTFL